MILSHPHLADYDRAIDRLEVDGFVIELAIDRRFGTAELRWRVPERTQKFSAGALACQTHIGPVLDELGRRAVAWCETHEHQES